MGCSWPTQFPKYALYQQDKSGEIEGSELLVLLRDVMKRMGLVRIIGNEYRYVLIYYIYF